MMLLANHDIFVGMISRMITLTSVYFDRTQVAAIPSQLNAICLASFWSWRDETGW